MASSRSALRIGRIGALFQISVLKGTWFRHVQNYDSPSTDSAQRVDPQEQGSSSSLRRCAAAKRVTPPLKFATEPCKVLLQTHLVHSGVS